MVASKRFSAKESESESLTPAFVDQRGQLTTSASRARVSAT